MVCSGTALALTVATLMKIFFMGPAYHYRVSTRVLLGACPESDESSPHILSFKVLDLGSLSLLATGIGVNLTLLLIIIVKLQINFSY
jgi:hypothetical protein